MADEAKWRRLEENLRGDLVKMLKAIEDEPAPPHRRMTRSATELAQLLSRIGRFKELGLSDAQGATLVEAVYKKSGLRLTGEPQGADSIASVASNSGVAYRAATEFEPLTKVLVRWPFDWPALQPSFALLIKHFTAGGVTVQIWVDTSKQRQAAEAQLSAAGVPLFQLQWTVENTDSIWIRDYGPQFLIGANSPARAIADFHYYRYRPNDDDAPLSVAAMLNLPIVDRQSTDVVYTEGGNFGHDGLGSVMYSERTYTKNKASAATVDQRILSAFTASRGIVVKDPTLDSTGHIDMFTKIIDASTVLVGQYAPNQIDYAVLETAAAKIAASSNGAGKKWQVVRIPQPDVYYTQFVTPVVRTYTNAQMANNVVVVPTYGIAADEIALATYRKLLPGRQVVGLNANTIIESGGAWHCVTMEMPAAVQ